MKFRFYFRKLRFGIQITTRAKLFVSLVQLMRFFWIENLLILFI